MNKCFNKVHAGKQLSELMKTIQDVKEDLTKKQNN